MQALLWIIGVSIYLSIAAASVGYYRNKMKNKDKPLRIDYEGKKYEEGWHGTRMTGDYLEAIARSFWGIVFHGLAWPTPVVFMVVLGVLRYPYSFGMKLFETPDTYEEYKLLEKSHLNVFDDEDELSKKIEQATATKQAEEENEEENVQRVQCRNEACEERSRNIAKKSLMSGKPSAKGRQSFREPPENT